MKALREQNIVHRDLKPGNILIKRHPTTGKMMVSQSTIISPHVEGVTHVRGRDNASLLLVKPNNICYSFAVVLTLCLVAN